MTNYIDSVAKLFKYYKSLGDKTMDQVPKDKLFLQPNEACNSISVITNHLNGNMLSRWTDFLNTDGEKVWRNRDKEFEHTIETKEELLQKWEEGWACLFKAINSLTENDLKKEIYIRNQKHSVSDAINRQLAHYSYHIGQIVFIGKLIQNHEWNSLSIPIGKSSDYNKSKFSKPRAKGHFTDDL